MLINEEEISREELQSLLDDPSYCVRLEANRLCLHLFDQSNGEQLMMEAEDHASLGVFFDTTGTSDDRRLKTSNEQEKLYRSLMEKNSTSLHLLCQLAPRSEYLSRQVAFRLIELNMEHKLSTELLQHILPAVPVEALLQSWQRQTAYSINDFPWTSLSVTSIEDYYPFIYSTYFLSSSDARDQLDRMFPERKSALIEYFAEVQARLLPLNASQSRDRKQLDEHRQSIEKLVSKTEHLRLMHIKDFHEVAIPTVTIPVSRFCSSINVNITRLSDFQVAHDGVYRNIETVKYFHQEYTMVGGVNAPKKLICHSSTGRQLPQLLKGKDDLRQDAVMQQLFNVVNRLLEKESLTFHRSLQIRTYKVVPLTSVFSISSALSTIFVVVF